MDDVRGSVEGENMRKIWLLCVVAATVLVPAPAEAAHSHYGESARTVAREIGCKNFTGHGSGAYNLGSGVCWVKGRRVNVITFRGPYQQGQWNGYAKSAFPADFHWGNGKGALVVARNGNYRSARIGANRLPGVVVHG